MSDSQDHADGAAPQHLDAYFAHEHITNEFQEVSAHLNALHLRLVALAEPLLDEEDLEDSLTIMATAVGRSATFIYNCMQTAYLFREMPRLAEYIHSRKHLNYEQLRTLTQALVPVIVVSKHRLEACDEILPEGFDLTALEDKAIATVSPQTRNQAINGSKTIGTKLRAAIAEVTPQLRPRLNPDQRDGELDHVVRQLRVNKTAIQKALQQIYEFAGAETHAAVADAAIGDAATNMELTAQQVVGNHHPKNLDEYVCLNADVSESTSRIIMQLASPTALEFMATITAIAGREECTYAEAVSHLVHGTVDGIELTLNLHAALTDGTEAPAMYMEKAGWLDSDQSQHWLNQVTHVRTLTPSSIQGYAPSKSQRAYVIARDGCCRFPGCDVRAENCDIDHLIPYNHDDPGAGGQTDTANLHALCRAHHNLKTAGLWGVATDERGCDGEEYWYPRTTRARHHWIRSEVGDELANDGLHHVATITSLAEGPAALPCARDTFLTKQHRVASSLHEHNIARLAQLAAAKADVEAARKFLTWCRSILEQPEREPPF